MRQVSSRQAAIHRQRRQLADSYQDRPPCDVPWCLSPADDLHETLTRARGGSPVDEENIRPLCRPCHDLITAGPLWAYALGLLRHSHPADPAVFARLVTTDSLGRSYIRESLAERLWRSIDASRGLNACWPWMACTNVKGYGDMGDALAHRVAYRVAYGPIPPRLQVQHEVCDNPPCCNFAHLITGTPAHNTAMMMARRRNVAPTGDRNGKTKLTDAQVAVIRSRAGEGWTVRSIAVTYGVPISTIRNIVTGRRRGTG